MTPDDVDRELYYWIQVANESRDRFLLPVGLIEESIARLKFVMGQAFLATVLQKSEQPIALLVGEEISPLRLWLGSPGVDKHILQVLEFCASLRTFANDRQLDAKIEKLKRDAFHPIFFELAIAHRLNASAAPYGAVALSAENDEAVGDFSLNLGRNLFACECSRLGFGPCEENQFRILNLIYDYIADFAKNNPGKRLIKIKVTEPLISQVYNPRLLGRLKRAINQFDRDLTKGSSSDHTIEVRVEALSPSSERIPFEMINGRVTDVVGTSWSSAISIGNMSGYAERQLAELYRKGIKAEPDEHTRVLVEFPRDEDDSNPYKRLRQKINSKVKQTKLTAGYAGKLIFIECQFNLRKADLAKLQKQIDDEIRQSSSTAGIFVCKREANPHYRHHYSMVSTINSAACAVLPGLDPTLRRLIQRDSQFDPITGERYLLTWDDARKRVAAYEGHSA